MNNFPIIGICGKSGSGKSALSNIIAVQGKTQQIALADPIKRFLRNAFDIPYHYLWGESNKRNELINKWRTLRENVVDSRSAQHIRCLAESIGVKSDFIYQWVVKTAKEPSVSARFLLTNLGTDHVRKQDPDAWIDLCLKISMDCLAGGLEYLPEMGPVLDSSGKCDRVLITDVRFRNEALGILKVGGSLVKINRSSGFGSTTPKHSSEDLDIPNGWFYETIENNGSLEDLAGQAKYL